jgi:hypothetical protein
MGKNYILDHVRPDPIFGAMIAKDNAARRRNAKL